MKIENEKYLSEQIITYLGNKRSLLDFIDKAIMIVKSDLNQEKLAIVDIFSGSGIVARYLKQHANLLITNDLENFSYTLNKCYLSNQSEIDFDYLFKYYNILIETLATKLEAGFISELYAPKDSNGIKKGERVFYTTRNAMYIDTCRKIIETFPKEIQHFFIAPLLSEASIKNNTGGVFKGFYKNRESGIGQFGGINENALSRILSDINLPFPIFSNFECQTINYQTDANQLVEELEAVDLIYMDPPYNQHPYGSNYFMLNLINDYQKPDSISKVSGIPKLWNRSNYNNKKKALENMEKLCQSAKAKYLLISFNSEGFISKEDMIAMLENIGQLRVLTKEYPTYRASRNLANRDIHVYEYLFLVKKHK